MAKIKNHSDKDLTLSPMLGFEAIRFMPGEVKDIDPERLKGYAAEDVKCLRPYQPEPAAPLAQPAPIAPTEDEKSAAELIAMLKAANEPAPS